jgi:hypothetical protein
LQRQSADTSASYRAAGRSAEAKFNPGFTPGASARANAIFGLLQNIQTGKPRRFDDLHALSFRSSYPIVTGKAAIRWAIAPNSSHVSPENRMPPSRPGAMNNPVPAILAAFQRPAGAHE